MWRLIGILLVVWLVVTVVGAVVEGLFWLVVVGLLFFAGTAAPAGTSAAPSSRRAGADSRLSCSAPARAVNPLLPGGPQQWDQPWVVERVQ